MAQSLNVQVLADASQYERELKKAARATKQFNDTTHRTGRQAEKAFGGLRRQIAFASASLIGGAGLIAAVRSSVSAASDLNEAVTKTQAVFGTSADEVEHWSKRLAASFGLAEGEALGIASSFGALFAPMGLVGEEAVEQSEKLTQLGADLASFYNTDVTDALQAVQSGLVGQARPLRRYGILLDAARVQQEALRETGKQHAAQLTNQEKVLARIAIVFHDSALAQGDFARTSGGLANQQRILRANITNLQETIGKELLPDILKVVKAMNVWLSDRQNVERLRANIRGVVEALSRMIGTADRVAKAFGGWKIAIEFIVSAALLSKLAKVTKAFLAIRTAALAAAGAEGIAAMMPFLGPAGLIAVGTIAMAAVVIANWDKILDGVQRYSKGLDGVTRKTIESQDEMFANLIRRAKQAGSIGPGGPIGQGGNVSRPPPLTGGPSDRSFSPGFGFGRTSAERQQDAADLAAAARAARPGKLGFKARMAKLDLALAKAELTATQKDDRLILVTEAALIRERVKKVHNIKKQTELLQQLKQITDQITAIDDEAASDAKDARDKELARKKKEADAAAAHAAKLKALAARQKQALQAASTAVISAMGDLFAGPFTPDDPARGILGVTGGKLSAKTLTAGLKAQTAQFVAFNNDLARLAKRGAPPALIQTLFGQGVSGAANVHALATASRSDLNNFLTAYGRRQKIAQQIAHADIQAKTVVIHAGSIRPSATSPSSQRRGPKAGVVIQGGNVRGN